ncbi:MAG: IPT/TIG domain-containing protein [Acidobacteriota bacterium]
MLLPAPNSRRATIGYAGRISFDELLTRTFQRASNRLEGLWWVPSRRSKLELVLSNRSESEVTATVSGQSLGRTAERRSVSVNLGPRETRVLNLPRVWTLEREMGRGAWAAGSLSVTYDGAPRDLVARGMVEDRALRYSGVVEFSDPAAGVGPELHGAGWRLGEFEGAPLAPVLVVRNIADEASTVTIRIPYSESEGATGRLELEPVVLEPGEIRDLSAEVLEATQDLARLQGVTLGLELTSTGAPGTLLAAAESVSLDGDQVFRVPLIDPQTKGAAGNYPWRVDGDVSTVVYLKNVTSEPRDYTVQFDFDGGSYVVGMDTLDPDETVAIDVRELRDSQRPDVHGTVIPPDASEGQVHWSAQGEGAQHSMLGRAEYVDAVHGFSSTYACSHCCPDTYWDSWLTPAEATLQVGTLVDWSAFQRNRNCFGSFLSPFQVWNANWSSTYPSVLHSEGAGSFTGVDAGDADAEARWFACTFTHSYLIGICSESCAMRAPSSPVGVIPVISGLSPAKGLVGSSVQVTISGHGFTNNPSVSVAGAGVTASVQSHSSTTINATFSIASYAEAGSHTVRVTAGGKPSNMVSFLVRVPNVAVTKADIRTDEIEVLLSPSDEGSHALTVTLVGNSGDVSLYSGEKGGGTYTFSFNRPNLPVGQYTSVRAEWATGSPPTLNGRDSAFYVLGTYRHSRYNTPHESSCVGTREPAFITDSQTCTAQSAQLKSDFISQAWLNGSGIADNFGPIQDEGWCDIPPGGSQRTFRDVSQIAAYCGQINNYTVAVNANNQNLRCGDEVLILASTPVIKSVTDRCPGCAIAQLDNYTTQAACQPRSIGDFGTFRTIRVNR